MKHFQLLLEEQLLYLTRFAERGGVKSGQI